MRASLVRLSSHTALHMVCSLILSHRIFSAKASFCSFGARFCNTVCREHMKLGDIYFILAKHTVSLRHCCFTYILSLANCVAADDVSKLILSHSLRETQCVCALFICTIRIAHTKCEPIDKGETVNTSNENISAISTLDSIQSSTTTIFPTRKLFRRHTKSICTTSLILFVT